MKKPLKAVTNGCGSGYKLNWGQKSKLTGDEMIP